MRGRPFIMRSAFQWDDSLELNGVGRIVHRGNRKASMLSNWLSYLIRMHSPFLPCDRIRTGESPAPDHSFYDLLNEMVD